MGFLASLAPVVMIAPLFVIYRRKLVGRKFKLAVVAQAAAFFSVCILVCALGVGAAYASAETGAASAEASSAIASHAGLGMIAAAAATGMSCLGAGFAVAAAASAAMGAISENEQTFGKALIFVALAEGVALYGFLISFLILGKF